MESVGSFRTAAINPLGSTTEGGLSPSMSDSDSMYSFATASEGILGISTGGSLLRATRSRRPKIQRAVMECALRIDKFRVSFCEMRDADLSASSPNAQLMTWGPASPSVFVDESKSENVKAWFEDLRTEGLDADTIPQAPTSAMRSRIRGFSDARAQVLEDVLSSGVDGDGDGDGSGREGVSVAMRSSVGHADDANEDELESNGSTEDAEMVVLEIAGLAAKVASRTFDWSAKVDVNGITVEDMTCANRFATERSPQFLLEISASARTLGAIRCHRLLLTATVVSASDLSLYRASRLSLTELSTI